MTLSNINPSEIATIVSIHTDEALHPWLGLPIFFAIMFLLFQAIFLFGLPLQVGVSELFGWLRETAIAPVFSSLPGAPQGLLLDGVYNGITAVAKLRVPSKRASISLLIENIS